MQWVASILVDSNMILNPLNKAAFQEIQCPIVFSSANVHFCEMHTADSCHRLKMASPNVHLILRETGHMKGSLL